jgi:hypothetical protein
MEIISVTRISARQYVNTVSRRITMAVILVNVRSHAKVTFVHLEANAWSSEIRNALSDRDYVNLSPFVSLICFTLIHAVSFCVNNLDKIILKIEFVLENGTPLTHNFTDEIAYCQEELNASEYQLTSFFDSADDSIEGRSMMSKIACPDGYTCKRLRGQSTSVCCPHDLVTAGSSNQDDADATTERQQSSELSHLKIS